jgi:hypothetical protein
MLERADESSFTKRTTKISHQDQRILKEYHDAYHEPLIGSNLGRPKEPLDDDEVNYSTLKL